MLTAILRFPNIFLNPTSSNLQTIITKSKKGIRYIIGFFIIGVIIKTAIKLKLKTYVIKLLNSFVPLLKIHLQNFINGFVITSPQFKFPNFNIIVRVNYMITKKIEAAIMARAKGNPYSRV